MFKGYKCKAFPSEGCKNVVFTVSHRLLSEPPTIRPTEEDKTLLLCVRLFSNSVGTYMVKLEIVHQIDGHKSQQSVY